MKSPHYILDIYLERPKILSIRSINRKLKYRFENKELFKCRENAFKKIRIFESIFFFEDLYPGNNIISSFSRDDKIKFRSFGSYSVRLTFEYQSSLGTTRIPIYGHGMKDVDSLDDEQWLTNLEKEFHYYKKNKHKMPHNVITRLDEESGIISTLSIGYEEFMKREGFDEMEELVSAYDCAVV